MKNALITCAALLGVGLAGALLFMWSGVYNVAADAEISSLQRWVLQTTAERSVAVRSGDIEVPDLDDPALVRSGASHYDEMCVGCHGAPGVDPGEIARGLHPTPPELAEGDEDFEPAEAFWITKHGVKLTGMPAWGTSHDDEAIWGLVALMAKFPDMSPSAYRRLVASSEGAGGHDHGSHEH